MDVYYLTTFDNPYDPRTDMDKWLAYDVMLPYSATTYLDRVAPTSPYLTDAENQRIINSAIDDIVRLDDLGLYQKLVESSA